MNPLARLGLWSRRGFGRIVPDPFVIAVGLTALVMVLAVLGGHGPLAVIDDWSVGGDAKPGTRGLWALLVFTVQMCLMLVLGSALAAAPAVQRGLAGLVARARTPRGLVAVTAAAAIVLALLNWSLGIIGGAILAREAGKHAKRRGWSLHYPILCAAGYSGLMVWHGGLSGSAPLKAASEGGQAEVLGAELAARVQTIPLDDSIFSPLNLAVTGGLLVLGPLLFAALTPAAGADPNPMSAPELVEPQSPAEGPPQTGVERIERSPVVVWLLALPMAAALGLLFSDGGIARLDFNAVNLVLWCAALILHGRPHAFVRACAEGVRACTGIILQFPLYAGIMGIMAGSGMSVALSKAFAGAGPRLFLVLTFLSAGLLNLFVPSGGGQWAVQGSILMNAALELDLAPSHALLAMVYGDQWTNMLQPFWALPLLAITGVRARDIVGYTVIWMAVGGVWIAAALTLAT